MDRATHTIGRFEIIAIVDADFPDEPIVDAFPAIPADALLEAKRTFPGVCTDDDRWRLWVRAWLLRHPTGILLLDTGIGGPGSPTQAWAPHPGRLAAALTELNVEPGDVDTVVISHVHDDHIGGVLGDDGGPRFPDARYVVQRADVEWQRRVAPDADGNDVWGLIASLDAAGLLDTVDGDRELGRGLALRHLPGHTPGHQVLFVEDADQRMALTADTWNHPIQLDHPEWPSGPDHDHAEAAVARRAMLVDLDAHPGTIVAPTHFVEAFGTIVAHGDRRTWTPLGATADTTPTL